MRTSRSRIDVGLVFVVLSAAGCSHSHSVDASMDTRDASADPCASDAAVERDGQATFMCPSPASPRPWTSPGECWAWAQIVGAGLTDPDAVSVRTQAADRGDGGVYVYCVRANYCAGNDPSSCQCGRGPACGVGQICARRSRCDPMECLPCTANY